jgi:exodeoxyribonuclease V alpha subunit
MQKGEDKMETRLIEVDKAQYVKESGNFVLDATHLTENKRRRKKSGPYTRRKRGRYVGELPIALVGDIFECEVEAVYSKKVGTWFRIHSAIRKSPVSLVQIERFLRKYIPGMTQDRLEQIVEKHGLDTLQVIQNDPNAFEFAGLLPENSEELRRILNEMEEYEKVIIILQTSGVDCRLAYPLFQKYNVAASRILQSDPYLPYAEEIYDFQTADRLYLKQGHVPDDPKRCRFAIYAMLRTELDKRGNLFVRKDNLKEKLLAFLHTDRLPFMDETIAESVGCLQKHGYIVIETALGGKEIYLRTSYEDERTAAASIERVWLGEKRIVVSAADVEAYFSQCGYSLAPEQQEAVLTALTSPITIISGGPGTGKTHTIKVIVDAISTLCPFAAVKLCAPTGRASVRIGEVTGGESATIHSMLELKSYTKDYATPKALTCDYLIVDEFSMVDMQICQYLFMAASSKTRVIILGDHNQLPSVGPGLVLRDMIDAKIFPVVTLTRIFRQDVQEKPSRIIENAHSIIAPADAKKKLRFANPQKPGEDFYFLGKDGPRSILETIQTVVETAVNNDHVPLESIAVLTPIHYGDLGTANLNTVLQSRLNPSTEKLQFKDMEFRLHDKVIHTENDYSLGVYNGEVGFIVEFGDTSDAALTVAYPGKTVIYPRAKLGKLDLAYAMTIHKMQGSECRLVVMPVFNNRLSKHGIYTAVTRAKRSVVLIGNEEDLRKGLQVEIQERESNLRKRLQAQILHTVFPSPAPSVSKELAGGDEQQSLFLPAPAPSAASPLCPNRDITLESSLA